MKVRRGGVGTHFVIHKYFYERSCSWKAIREEEHEARNHWKETGVHDVEGADRTDLDQTNQLNFTPIDARHLSSYPLISRRVVKLLRSSKNHIHASKDMLVILVFLFFSQLLRFLMYGILISIRDFPIPPKRTGDSSRRESTKWLKGA